MMKIKPLLAGLVLALFLVAPALAQSAGAQLGAGQVWGNPNASGQRGIPASISAMFDRALGSTQGKLIERGASGWGLIGPCTNNQTLFGVTGGDPTCRSITDADLPVIPIANGGTGATSLGTGLASSGGVFDLGKTHLVVYTVAPALASAADKARADYVGDGVNDQVAVNDAFAAATATTGDAEVKMLPGTYAFSAPVNLVSSNCYGFYFEARGTNITGPGGSADTFVTKNCNNAVFHFGIINAPGTGSAIHDEGNHTHATMTWQALIGTSEQGNGLYIDATATGAAQSVNTYTGTEVDHFDDGINMASTTNIDTDIINVNYIYNNNIGILVDSAESGNVINANTWNVNLDASWSSSAIAFKTNENYSFMNLVVGGLLPGGQNLQLDSGATSNIIDCTPANLCQNGGLVDTSGNTTNNITAGLPVSVLGGSLAGHFLKFGSTAGNYQQLVDGGAGGTDGAPSILIASGATAMGTSAIASGTCAAAVTATATGVLTTDAISASFNGDPTGITGYIPSTSGMLTIIMYPTAGDVNFKVCNNTANSITPGAVTINWRVVR